MPTFGKCNDLRWFTKPFLIVSDISTLYKEGQKDVQVWIYLDCTFNLLILFSCLVFLEDMTPKLSDIFSDDTSLFPSIQYATWSIYTGKNLLLQTKFEDLRGKLRK